MQYFNVIIVGGGAAGLFCAIQAAKRGRKVLVIDHAKKMAEKIRISGGGRCNFTNLHASPSDFLSNNPRFCVSALKRYTQQDFISLVEKHGIKYHEKTLGQLFCDDSAQQIIDMLIKECQSNHVKLSTRTSIQKIEKTEGGFSLETSMGPVSSESLVVACGGKSIPKMGATGFGFEIAQQFDIDVLPTRAALVPLTFTDGLLDQMKAYSGLSVDAEVHAGKTKFREGLLFTHRGLSGPSILQISSYWAEGSDIRVNLSPDFNIQDELKLARDKHPKKSLTTILTSFIPKRLAEKITADAGADRIMAELGKKTVNKAADLINNWQIKPSGTEGYRTAEVTLGGVNTNELSSKTFESKKVTGLYFIGEVVDVTGHLGGFNFQWAWSSGYCAGQYV